MDPENLEYINQLLDKDADIREKIKDEVTEFDKRTRTLCGMLNRIHSTPSDKIFALLDSVDPVIATCRDSTAALARLVPPDQFWRWKDMWCISLRNAVYGVTLVGFLRNGSLPTIAQTAETLGIQEEWSDRLRLAAEDYLHGLITLVNELSRLCVNAVTLGNYELPIRISNFVKDLFAGFAMLNLKNDTLRKRYDSLKYDLKKIEEVVYDVSLRKLAPPPAKKTDKDSEGNSEGNPPSA